MGVSPVRLPPQRFVHGRDAHATFGINSLVMADAVETPTSPAPVQASSSPLDRPIDLLDGVGPTRARKLKRLGLNRLGDLLEYFPRAYQQEFAEGSIAQLKPDQIHTVRGTVVAVDYVPVRPRPRFEATLNDGPA
jgi:hypothetical protein